MSSHSASDSGMQRMMIIVAIALSLLTITIMITARTLSSGSNDEFDPLLENVKLERIQPVARVRTEAPVAETVAAAPAASGKTGEELATVGTCAGCHNAGVADAPLFSDTEGWAARAEAGLEALVASVVNGKGAMPARGGSDYTDEEITRAVEYITGLGNGGAVAAETAAPAAEEAASTEADSASVSESAADIAADPKVAVTTEAAQPAAETEAQADSAAESTDTAATGSEASIGATPADGVLAALTPRIKTTVDQGVCAGCHTAGVAGAPKFDDTDAWAARAEMGYAALAQTVINGKGAMPPRGGSGLTDDELLVAVEYMVQNSR